MVSISTATCLVLILIPILGQVHGWIAHTDTCPEGKSVGDKWEIVPGECKGDCKCEEDGATCTGCAPYHLRGIYGIVCYDLPEELRHPPNCCGSQIVCRWDADFNETLASPLGRLQDDYDARIASGDRDFNGWDLVLDDMKASGF